MQDFFHQPPSAEKVTTEVSNARDSLKMIEETKGYPKEMISHLSEKIDDLEAAVTGAKGVYAKEIVAPEKRDPAKDKEAVQAIATEVENTHDLLDEAFKAFVKTKPS